MSEFIVSFLLGALGGYLFLLLYSYLKRRRLPTVPTTEEIVGKHGRVTVAFSTIAGEVVLDMRGGSEAFIAYGNGVKFYRGQEIIVTGYQAPRTVYVAQLDGYAGLAQQQFNKQL